MSAVSVKLRNLMTDLNEMASQCGALEPDVKQMIEQSWSASQHGQPEIVRELLSQAEEQIAR